MRLFDFLKPKWKSRNPEVRLAAVGGMGAKELGTLKAVAAADGDPRVQLAAVERIGDREALEELIRGVLEPDVFRAVRAKIDRLLCEEALGGGTPAGLEDALGRVEDLGLVERLAAQAATPALRVRAVERIEDPEALCRIVETNCGKEPARAALAKIQEEPLLERVARSASSKVTRRLAAEKLAALASERAAPEETVPRDLQREEPVAEAEPETLAPSDDGPAADRQAGPRPAETSEAAAAALAAVEALEGEQRRLGELTAELDRLEALPPQELDRARRSLAELDRSARAEGFRHLDPASLLARLDGIQRACEERAAARAADEVRIRRETLERRAELCAEFEGLLEAGDRAAAGRRVKELRKAWKNLPASPEPEARALEERFAATAERFSVRQAAFHEQQDWLRWNNRTLKEDLCVAVEALDAEEDLATLADKVKEAQRRWKEIGPAPKAVAEALWQRFQTACDRGFERCKPYLEEQERRSAEGIERREELCREAEGHVESTAWKESAEALKRLQEQWKEAGPVPRGQDRALYARFRQACDRFFARRETYLVELDESRRGNQAEKEQLCARAEALAAEPERGHAREFRELQAAWKQAGPAPRDAERQLWERFRASCDRFFAWLDVGRQENLRKKEALCEEVEAVMSGFGTDADPQDVTAKVTELQKRWNEIGPVPKDEDEAICERFHRPVDAFFEARRQRGVSGAGAATGPTA
ncbi:MAG: DUF349 domain-containing protein [Deltaproteobacteria bacterium]|nr:DUF349 domain-containing protein [Deltaproteobacteria bacterium]